MKHTHRKVRSGCLVCRRRRVKCDELRPECTQCLRLHATRGDPINCCYESSRAVNQPKIPLPWDPVAVTQYGWMGPTTRMERQLLHHLCTIRRDFDIVQREGLAAGINQFSRYFAMAENIDYLRHCFYAFGAGHLRTLTQSTNMAAVEYHYRGLAIQGMIVTLSGNKTINEMKALLGATTIMAWYAREPREYGAFLKGISALIPHEERNRQAPNTVCDESTLIAPPIENKIEVLHLVTEAVQAFSKCKLDQDLRNATKEILNFVYNIQKFPWTDTALDEQFSTMFPLRNWVRWVPQAPERLASNDFLLLLLVANYETVLLAMGLLLPAINTPLALHERFQCTTRFSQSISGHYGSQDESVSRAVTKWQAASEACTQLYADNWPVAQMEPSSSFDPRMLSMSVVPYRGFGSARLRGCR